MRAQRLSHVFRALRTLPRFYLCGLGDFFLVYEIADWQRHLLTDPQTSGGLLVACSPESVKEVLAEFHQQGFSDARVIGELKEGVAEVHVK